MSDDVTEVVRWLLLLLSICASLQATLFFQIFQRRLVTPWLAMYERAGIRIPKVFQSSAVQRSWLLLMAIFFFGAWRYLSVARG